MRDAKDRRALIGWFIFFVLFAMGNYILYKLTGWTLIPVPLL